MIRMKICIAFHQIVDIGIVVAGLCGCGDKL
jgi:hypothetical protein